MTDYPKTAQTLITLLTCAVNETPCTLSPEEIDFDALYALAKSHVLCAAVGYALESAGIEERRFTQAKLKAKRKIGLFDIERARVFEKLDEAGIWHLPLKGAVLAACYPRYGMREMSDNDILCDSSKMEEVREIMKSLGYTCESFGEWHHDSYQKPPTLEFEMHRTLFETDDMPALDEYYASIFDRLIPQHGYEYAFSHEDFYIYMLAHTYKHFSHNGTGLRPLLDIYVYLKARPDLDLPYIEEELQKLWIAEFELRCRRLAKGLFGTEPLSEEDAELLPQFLYSPLYGTQEQGEYNYLTRSLDGSDAKSAKARFFWEWFFLHGNDLRKKYPFFARHKWLLPVLYVYRPVKGVLTHPKAIARRIGNVVKYRSPKKRH